MFTKILIANRGEIAIRIIRACKEMGISTVAVYSEADRESLHVALADEAICIGGPRADDSYLNGERIVSAALATHAQAIHPGYGFLSENAGFAALCKEHGVVFIGPPAEVISNMGDKDAARRLMKQNNVPTTPGTDILRNAQEAKEAAANIGYPVLIKASAGGGGKGIRLIDWEEYHNSAFGRTDWVRAFVDEVHAQTGVWPLVYVSESAIPQVANTANDCGLWVAKYPSMDWNSWTVPNMKVNVAPWATYTAWQFTGGDMDRDLINVDADGWHKLAKGSGKVEIKPQPAPQPQPQQPTNTWTDSLGDVWHAENGKFTTYESINLRWGAKTTSAKIATLPAGSTVVYDAWSKHDNWTWIRQPRGNGQYGYMVCRDGSGKALGKFE